MDAETIELLDATLSQLLANERGTAATQALRDLGWDEVITDDLASSTNVLFTVQGRVLGSSSGLDVVMSTAMGLDRWTTRVLLPQHGISLSPSSAGDLSIVGFSTGGTSAEHLAVPVQHNGTTRVALVAADLATLRCQPVEGFDPDLGLQRWSGSCSSSELEWIDNAHWSAALAWGRIALAHELLGASQWMVDAAIEHVTERHQFGRAIGSFQAVRHHLVDAHVDIAAGTLTAREAGCNPTLASSTAAKALAGRAAATAQRSCQQVMGGIGFTWEHDLHRYIRRTLMLDALLGSAAELTAGIGARAIADRAIAPLGDIEDEPIS